MKLDKLVLANAFALSTAVLWTICSAFVWIFPDLSTAITKWWFHGIDLTLLGNWGLTLENFLLGGVTLVISLWICGYVLGWSWERVS